MTALEWKRHLRPVVLPPDHLLVLSETTHHLFRGDAYVRAADLLDGRWSHEELHHRLEGAGVPQLSARLVIGHLEALGLLCDAAPRAAGLEEITFWQSLGDDGGAAERIARARVAVDGGAARGAAEVQRALDAAGVGRTDETAGSDLVVVVADDALDARLEAINRERLAAGRPWLLVKPAGTVPWIGPLFIPGRTGCWACLAQRLRLNREVERLVEQRLGPSAAPPVPVTPSSLAIAAELAALEVVRHLAMGPDDAAVVSLDLKTNALVRHPLTRRPQCAACGRPGTAVIAPLALTSVPKTVFPGGRRDSAEATLARLAHHVSPITGPIRALHESNESGYVHVAASQAFPMFHYDFRVLRDNLSGRSGGKGIDPARARASAICEALERFSGTWQGEDEVVTAATRAELGDAAIDPAVLFGFSARQYAAREAWNATNDEPHAWVPRPLDDRLRVDWVELRSLTTSRSWLAPAAYCYYGHPDLGQAFCAADSNGCAAGSTLTEAVAHGLLELIERDAAAIWWYNRARRPAIDLEGFGLPVVDELREIYRKRRRTFWALDLTTDLGVPVIAAISARTDHPVEDIIYGFGADFEPAAALDKALLEMNQSLFSVIDSVSEGRTRYRTDRAAARRWFEAATRASEPYLVPDPDHRARLPEDFCRRSCADWRDDVQHTVDLLQRSGMDTLVLDQTRPDIELPVCRVVVPGLCHFWRRFGLARLYEVPVRLGWLASPRAEADLNPWFIYF